MESGGWLMMWLVSALPTGACLGCASSDRSEQADSAAAWRALPAMPVSNGDFAAGIVDRQFLIIGGTTWSDGTKRWLSDVASFSITTGQWRLAEPWPMPNAYAAFASNERGVYILGGSDGTTTSQDFYRVTSVSSKQHVYRTGHAVIYAGAAANDDALYIVAGGEHVSDLTSLSDRILRVALDTGDVTELPAYPGGAVMLPSVTYSE